jgi:KDO2-lipid IV(A) lauroyltransferase
MVKGANSGRAARVGRIGLKVTAPLTSFNRRADGTTGTFLKIPVPAADSSLVPIPDSGGGTIAGGNKLAAKRRNRLADLAVYLVIRLIVCVVQALPARAAYRLADGMAWALYRFAGRRREIARENLAAAFPEQASNPVAIDRIVRGMFQHFMRAAIELILIRRKLSLSTWRRHVVLPNGEKILPPLLSDRAALIVTAHLGNWELAGISLGLFGYHTHAIARVQDNPYLEQFVRKFRQSAGQQIIAKNGEFDQLAAVMKSGGKVAVLADQDAGPRGVFVEFFGRPASAHKAIALLAMQHDAVLVITGVPRVQRGDYLPDPVNRHAPGLEPMFYAVTCEDVIDPRDYAGMSRAAAVREITQRYTSAFERMIRRYPEQYFWLHRRWKTRPAEKRTSRAA